MKPGATWLKVLECVRNRNDQKRFKRRDVQRRQSKAIRSARHMREVSA